MSDHEMSMDELIDYMPGYEWITPPEEDSWERDYHGYKITINYSHADSTFSFSIGEKMEAVGGFKSEDHAFEEACNRIDAVLDSL